MRLPGLATAEPLAQPSKAAFEEFQRDRLGFLRRCAETADVVSVRIGPDDVMVLSRPELVTDVLLTHRADFSKGYLTSVMHPLLAGSLLLVDSDSWLHQRKLMLPAFHREHLSAYAAVMAEEAENMIAPWRSGEPRDLHSDMMRMTLQIVTRTLFGIDLAGTVGVAEQLIATLMDEFNRRIASPVRLRFPLPACARFGLRARCASSTRSPTARSRKDAPGRSRTCFRC